MHGLVFVTWEKFLGEQFGSSLLTTYRKMIGETAATAPLANRVYEDELLLHSVGVAEQLTHTPAQTLLRLYGRYFIANRLTGHLCKYLLSQVHSARELLLTMRAAHAQLRRTPDALTPPLFGYEAISSSPNELALIYQSHRRLCPLLLGAIEGAAQRYGEEVQVVERTCMQRGDAACRFEIRFLTRERSTGEIETPARQARLSEKRRLADLLLTLLPESGGVTLIELQKKLLTMQVPPNYLRPSMLLEALQQLQFVGLVSYSPSHLNEDLMHRRYWRAPTRDALSPARDHVRF
jgi:hypothetical protein